MASAARCWFRRSWRVHQSSQAEENLTIEELSIRPIAPEDAEQLGELLVALAAGSEARQFHPHPLTAQEACRIAQGAAARKDLYFAAFLGERLVGYGMLRGWDEGYSIPSFGVAVSLAYRGRGIARSLLRYAIQRARESGAGTMMLKVHLNNHDARHIYESEGFVFQEIQGDATQIKGLLSL
jgi:ribosomal protein S18 acetylase RimI-like enzyme